MFFGCSAASNVVAHFTSSAARLCSPQYFDHNKFSSFARQLNFYGFRKIQTKPIRNEDFDKSTAKHVTFYNDKFKRGRYDLLKEIQRSTRGGGSQHSMADQAREIDTLRNTVVALEQRVQELEAASMRMGQEVNAKVEMAFMEVLASGRLPSMGTLGAQYGMPSLPTSLGDAAILQRAERSFGSVGRNPEGANWQNPLLGPQAARAFSTASASSAGAAAQGGGSGAASAASGGGATLPPHPKQKSLPPPAVGGTVQAASSGLRNLSTATNSSLLLRNAWEDKFFSTLMMQDGASRAASLAMASGMNPAMGNVSGLAALAAAQQMQNQNAAMMAQAAKDSAMQRQTTAEILLEAAGELDNAGKGKDGAGAANAGKDAAV